MKSRKGFFKLIDDAVMVFIVLLNLLFLTFDWLFGFAFFQEFIQFLSTDFFLHYREQIHPNFLIYDAYFVAIFITELIVRWIIAAKDKVYDRWWLYPVAHWYDVLGCIPLGTFRWLRILRLVSMVLRLHKMRVIDLKESYLYQQTHYLFKLFTNKVTDSVLINLVSGIQREVSKASDPEESGSTIADAVKPDQHQLAKAVTQRIQKAAKNNYDKHRETLKDQIETIVKEGFEGSKEMKKIESLPLVGKQITQTLEDTLGDITYQLVDSLFNQAMSEETGKLLEDSINTTLEAIFSEKETAIDEHEEELNRIIRKILGRILDRVKKDIGKDDMLLNPEQT